MNSKLELARMSAHPDFARLDQIEGLKIDLRYATSDNFMNRNVYGEFRTAFLHRLAAEKLDQASKALRREHPGFSLLILDAFRPQAAQYVLWDHVKGTPQEAYVANPERGSMHSYGCAVDLTVLDEKGRELDMGTGFDSFIPLSQPKLEAQFLSEGKLSENQYKNRLILRSAMEEAGFIQLPHEWWHYDAFTGDEVRSKFVMP
jgi:D-alanyl-D-alanine dipeptidase